MDTTEAAGLARVILADTETDRHMDLYTLTVIEARTLAHAVTRVEELAEELAEELRGVARESYQVDMDDAGDAYQAAADLILAVLNGEADD